MPGDQSEPTKFAEKIGATVSICEFGGFETCSMKIQQQPEVTLKFKRTRRRSAPVLRAIARHGPPNYALYSTFSCI